MREIQRQQKRRDDFSKTRAVTKEGDTCVLKIKDWTLKERQAGLGM